MSLDSLSHLSNHELLCHVATTVARDCRTTALLLAQLAEIDRRRLYATEGYESMYAFCVGRLRMAEYIAYLRIRAARAARKYPMIFDAVAEGRLPLPAVVKLWPHLTRENATELLKAAEYKTKTEVLQLIAQRFPSTEVLPLVSAAPASSLPANAVEPNKQIVSEATPLNPERVVTKPELGPDPVEVRHNVAPIAPQRVEFRFSGSQNAYEKLCYLQALLSHKIPAGDIAEIFELALDELIIQVEKSKFAKTSRPRANETSGRTDTRHIPAAVKRVVWDRDGGRCSYVSDSGQRCEGREVEFDHTIPVARGGRSSAENVRLLCRAHNQFEAERVFGIEFMERKRPA